MSRRQIRSAHTHRNFLKTAAIVAAASGFAGGKPARLPNIVLVMADLDWKELKVDDNTIVLFTSDNGATYLKQVDFKFFDSVGEFRGLKGSVYEGGVREPFIVRWPGKIAPGSVSDHIGAHYDVLPTLAEIAGAPVPPETDGISILPELTGKPANQQKHEFIFWDFAGYKGQIAVRMGDWKGVKTNVQKNPNAPLELYNLKTDLSESKNVAEQHPDIVARLVELILRERDEPELKQFRFGVYRSRNNAE